MQISFWPESLQVPSWDVVTPKLHKLSKVPFQCGSEAETGDIFLLMATVQLTFQNGFQSTCPFLSSGEHVPEPSTEAGMNQSVV